MNKILPLFTTIIASISLILPSAALASEEIKQSCFPSSFDASACERFNPNSPDHHLFWMADKELETEANPLQNTSQILLNERLKLIDQLDDPQIKTEMLIELALEYYQIGEKTIALDTLKSALESSKNVESKSSQVWLMLKIAESYIELQDIETASQILDDSLTVVREITGKPETATLLIDLAAKYKQIGNSEKAELILAEVETLMAEIKNPPPSFPFQPRPLTAKIRAGTNFASGQNSLLNVSFAVDANKRWKRDELDLYFQFFSSYDNSRSADDETRIALDSLAQYKHYFVERRYFFANLSYLQDDFSANESKVSYFTGLGFNLWSGPSDDQSLDMQLGLGDLVRNSNVRNTNANFPVLQYALSFKDLWFVDWKFRQTFILEFPISNTANYYAESSTVLTIPAINNWSIFGALSFVYFGIPQLDSPNLSTRFTAGLEYEF